MSAEPDTCYQWSRDFVVAHAVFASGFVTAPVAVLLLHRRRSSRAIFFAAFAAFCTAFSLILCVRFYAELRRPPWPRWRSASAASGGGVGRREDGESGVGVGHGTTAREETSHALRHPEQPMVMRRAEVQADLAAGRIPSYEHPGGGDDGAAEDCAVCLGEVEKGETVRRLPECQHVFHRECIDLWLRAHATCPVCRSGVLQATERPVEEVVVNIGAVHGQPRAAILASPGIIFSGRPGQGFWFGPVSRMS